jgi:cytochrome c peroxidase
VIDRKAGRLDAEGAHGGPVALASQPFFIGINSGASFNPKVFDLYDAWEHSRNPHRRRIWRGQQVFNTKTFGNGRTCGGCHNTPNVGSSSTYVTRNVGTDDANEPVDLSYLPKLTIRNKTTGETRVVTDLGVGLDGVWAHVGQYKVQHLRGLASRTPLFHDGRAKTVRDVVDHYERFFNIDFHGSEKDDLVAFLNAL